MNTEKKYVFDESMREISGFGGGCELDCRRMVVAALEWLDNHSTAQLSYEEFEGVFGLTTGESEDLTEMQNVMFAAVESDCTGAMMHACTRHVMSIRKTGWNKYVEDMKGGITNEDL